MNRRSFTAISATIASAAATEATTPMQTTSAPEFHLDYAPGCNDGTPMIGGHISLQAESHPCQFRNIEIKILD